MSSNELNIASCSVAPTPDPDIWMSVTGLPFKSAPIFNISTFESSKNSSRSLLRYSWPDSSGIISRGLVISACLCAASGFNAILNE